MSRQFETDKAYGEQTEAFFQQYGKSLLFPPDDPRVPLHMQRFEPENGYYTDWPEHVSRDSSLVFEELHKTDEIIHVEGLDLTAWVINPASEAEIRQGTIEIKSVSRNGLISFGPDDYPSIPCEIRSQIGTARVGWLWYLLHPKEALERRKLSPDKLRTITPSAMVFCQYDGEIGSSRINATVSFYDFPILRSALIEIAKEKYNIDLSNWAYDTIPLFNSPHSRSPYWNVSIKWLRDKGVPMAVYMIGEDPKLEPNPYYEYSRQRLMKLKEIAAAHYELEQLKSVHEAFKVPDPQPPEWT